MLVNITARNIKLTKELASYVNKKMERLTKYIQNVVKAEVRLSVEKYRQIAEVKINAQRAIFTAKEVSTDMYAAIDLMVDKLERQVLKFRERVKEHHKEKTPEIDTSVFSKFWVNDGMEDLSEITSVKQLHIKPATCRQAIDDFKSLNTKFYVFLNESTNKISILFKRDNNSFGLLELNY